MATKVERHLLTIHADRSISVETDIPIVAGSIGVDEVLISFEEPEDWADMSLTVTMVSSVVETPYTVLWDGESAFNVPWELTQEIGVIGFSVLGISSSTQSYQRGLTQSSVGLLTVVTPGINVGDPPVEPTPSAYERVLAMIQSLPEVESRAEAVINDLDNAFRGVAQYLPVGMGNVVTAELDGTDSELVQASDAFKNAKLLGAKVYGKSTQESTTGAQLWPFGDQTFTSNVTLTFPTPLPAGSYMFSTKITSDDTDANGCMFAFKNGSRTVVTRQLGRNSNVSVALEFTSSVDSVILYASSSLGNSAGDTATWADINLNAGTTVLPIEPYTGGIASPNPDYPQEIKSVAEGDLKLTGKCIWGGEQMADDIVAAVNDSRYAVKGEDENGKYIALTAGSPMSSVAFFKTPYNLNKCSFIVCARKNNNSASTNLSFAFSDGTTRGLVFAVGTTEIGKIYTMASVSDTNKVVTAIQGSWQSGTVYIYYEQSGLFEGTLTVDDFTPYEGDTLHFLPDDIEPLRSLPDGTRDVLTIDANGNGVIERNVGVFDLSERANDNDWVLESYSSMNRFRSSVFPNALSTTTNNAFIVLCDRLKNSSEPIGGRSIANAIALYAGKPYILMDAEDYPTVTAFTQLLNTIKPTVLYELATPTTEIIPASRMPKVPSQYLHAWLEAKDQNGEEIVTDYSIYYEKSIGALLSQIEQALDAAGYPITDYEPEDAMSVAPVLSNDANPVTDAQMAAAVTYGFTLN